MKAIINYLRFSKIPGNPFGAVPVLASNFSSMKSIFTVSILLGLLSLGFQGCNDDNLRDTIPVTYFMIQLNPDDIYMYNSGNPNGVRLDPLVNDSVKVEVTISYSTPGFGTIKFIPNEGWFYVPNAGFYGIDNVTYTVCHPEGCGSASITLYVEEPLDPENCTYAIVGEEVETEKNQPVQIRIFDNDTVCPYAGSSVFSPEHGTFETYSYSGSYKNVVYVYYPPKNFTGTDKFKYRLFTSDGEVLEAYCTITVK